jgi:hypothetical protein
MRSSTSRASVASSQFCGAQEQIIVGGRALLVCKLLLFG